MTTHMVQHQMASPMARSVQMEIQQVQHQMTVQRQMEVQRRMVQHQMEVQLSNTKLGPAKIAHRVSDTKPTPNRCCVLTCPRLHGVAAAARTHLHSSIRRFASSLRRRAHCLLRAPASLARLRAGYALLGPHRRQLRVATGGSPCV